MSATEWMTASQVTRSLTGSRTASVSGVSAGSSSQASGQALDHSTVQSRVGWAVDGRAAVLALEVDRVDRPVPASSATSSSSQSGVASSLKRRPGIEREPRAQPLGRWRLAEAHRDDERQRRDLTTDDLAERPAGLAQREVERGALEAPAPIVEVGVLLRLVVEERQGREVLGERVQCPVAGEREDGAARCCWRSCSAAS